MSAGIHKFICRPDVDIYSILEIADGLLYEEKMEKKARYGSYR
jgi:PleD family two-component response regulator